MIKKCNISQSYYTVSIENIRAELMFLLMLLLVYRNLLNNQLSLISNKNLLPPWVKMMKSLKEGEWSQNKRWSRMELLTNGLTLLKVNGEIRCVLQTLLSSTCNWKNCIYDTEIYKQQEIRDHKVNDLWNGKHLRDFSGSWK